MCDLKKIVERAVQNEMAGRGLRALIDRKMV